MNKAAIRRQPILQERNMSDIEPEVSPRKSKRHSENEDEAPPTKSKRKEKEKQIVKEESEDDFDDAEEDPSNTYARRIILRNKLYRNVDLVESAQRRMENGDTDDLCVKKAVKCYVNSDILKDENRAIVNGRDLTIDSILGDRLSKVLLIKAGKLSSGRDKFNFGNFARLVKERGTLGEMYKKDVSGILDVAINFKTLAFVDFGSLPKAKKNRVARGPRKNDKDDLVNVKGQQTNEVSEEKDADFTKRLDYITRVFKKTVKERGVDRLNYYEFVIDPEDFGATVQNCFCTAFLLKDMRFYLEFEEDDDYPSIRVLSKDEKKMIKEAAEADRALAANQCVNTLTYSKYLGLIEELEIKEALLKQEEA